MTSQLYAVLAALIGGVLLMLYVEVRVRTGHERRHPQDCEPIFRRLRNGRVRFHLEDLLRSVQSTPGGRRSEDRAVHFDLGDTIPDVLGHQGPPQRRT